MRNQWQYFLLAVGFFTRIPVPSFADFQESDLNHSVQYFPLVGIIVGLVGAFSFYIAHAVLPMEVAVLISMASTIYITGAFHEDGLADSADGMGGGWDRERILTIMQDSRLGTYGVAALFFALLTKFAILKALSPAWLPAILVAGHALSRLCAVWLMATLNYTKSSGKAKPLATQIVGTDLIVSHLFGLLPFLCLVFYMNPINGLWMLKCLFIGIFPVALAWIWWRTKVKQWLGGYTGDTLGAMQQITEIAFYLGVLICAQMT